ncbi:hypothetical protein V3C99_011837 [Haemonchus contortus]
MVLLTPMKKIEQAQQAIEFVFLKHGEPKSSSNLQLGIEECFIRYDGNDISGILGMQFPIREGDRYFKNLKLSIVLGIFKFVNDWEISLSKPGRKRNSGGVGWQTRPIEMLFLYTSAELQRLIESHFLAHLSF